MRPGAAALLLLMLLADPAPVRAETPELDLVPISGGTFVMGDPAGPPDEAPRRVTVGDFRIMRNEVTNRQFAAFVAATGHRTDVEANGAAHLWTERWRRAQAADWRHPRGADSGLDGLDDHPVVQVSARDAAAFCEHYGLRLPREAEWEYAARGGDGRRYPWGNEPPRQGGVQRANYGSDICCAPDAADGYARTAPVGQYPAGASPFGLLDMAGNVWEWTADEFPGRPGMISIRGGGWGNNAFGLRATYRHWNPPDIGLDMVGFRCAGDAG